MSVEDFIANRGKAVQDRRKLLDRVRPMNEQLDHVANKTPGAPPAVRAGDLAPGVYEARELPAPAAGKYADLPPGSGADGPASAAEREVPGPESVAEREAAQAPEVPRDADGVPEFEAPRLPEAPVDADGNPTFRLRAPPVVDEQEE